MSKRSKRSKSSRGPRRLEARVEERTRELARKNAHLWALFETARLATLSLNLGDILPPLAKSAAELIGADASSIRLLDRSGTLLETVAHHGLSETFARCGPVKVGEGMTGRMVLDGKPVVVGDVERDRRVQHRAEILAEGLRSLAIVPLRSRDRIIGTLTVYARTVRRFPPDEVALLGQFGNLAALAIGNARLYQQAREAYEELAQAQARLVQSEKLRALGAMAGGVAHDFNNLLTPILGRAQYLLLRLGEGWVAPAEIERSLRIIERSALEGAETVRRLLGFTRATPGPGEVEAVDIGELFAAVVAAAEPRWKDEAQVRGVRLEVVQDVRTTAPVVGNPAELREVLLALVFNALDALPEGGTLRLTSWAEESTVCLAVTDTGVGIPEEVQAWIFDPFFTTKGPQASGLGLSVCYGIVRRHGGGIAVESRPGQGTTFTIRLPVREVPPPKPRGRPAPPSRGLRILAVDDEGEVRETLREILEVSGHEVYEAGSGPEALAILERREVDLVCIDLGMPGMSGWELADRVRAQWPGIRVALITGWGARVEPKELEAHGVDFLIPKPFQIEALLRTLSKLGPASGA